MKQEPQQGRTAHLRQAFEGILRRSHGEGLTIGCILEKLGARGRLAGLLFLTAPFLFPLPTMGLSAPVGLIVMLSGLALAFGRRPWTPGFISRRRISHDMLTRLTTRGTRVVNRFSAWLRPRWQFMFWPGLRQCIGLNLVSAGFILSLPLPIPFTNAIPAAAILLLCLGYIAGDGASVLLGHGVGLVAWGYLYIIGGAAWLAIRRLSEMH